MGGGLKGRNPSLRHRMPERLKVQIGVYVHTGEGESTGLMTWPTAIIVFDEKPLYVQYSKCVRRLNVCRQTSTVSVLLLGTGPGGLTGRKGSSTTNSARNAGPRFSHYLLAIARRKNQARRHEIAGPHCLL